MTSRRMLSNLFRVVLDEAQRNPDFEARLRGALGTAETASAKESVRPKRVKRRREPVVGATLVARRPSNRRPQAVLDPVQVVREGAHSLRAALTRLTLDQLHDIVADYGMDPGKIVMKWRTEAKVIDRIVEISLTRAHKGEAFRSDSLLTGGAQNERFSAQACMQRLVVECADSSAAFWLGPDRPTHGLAGIQLSLHNHLPFDVELSFHRIEARVDSMGLLDSPLNTSAVVGASNNSGLLLPEIALSNRPVQWLINLKRDVVVMDMTLHWSARSSMTNWEQSKQIKCAATIGKA